MVDESDINLGELPVTLDMAGGFFHVNIKGIDYRVSLDGTVKRITDLEKVSTDPNSGIIGEINSLIKATLVPGINNHQSVLLGMALKVIENLRTRTATLETTLTSLNDSTDQKFKDINTQMSGIITGVDNLITPITKYGSVMIGELVEWPLAKMPQEMWSDLGMIFIPYNGQTFDATLYPDLAIIHPDKKLPVDMRGYSVRGWDQGKGVDSQPTRALLSVQEDAIENITGAVKSSAGKYDSEKITGAFKLTGDLIGGAGFGGFNEMQMADFDASRVVRTATETRMKNVAWNYIVRAK